MKSVPSDALLYKKVKNNIYSRYPTHSAYRSGMIVKKYKSEFKKLHPRMSPYKGQTSILMGLARWFKENWKSDTGEYHYSNKSSVYRPSRRITKDTPTTFSELSKKQLQVAKSKKKRSGRVDRF